MTEDNENNVTNAHDAGFRAFFSVREVARSFFKEKLPKSINKHLDYRTLKISKDTFIDKQLADKRSDMLYEIKYKKSSLLLYLLFEHKSYKDPWVAFQMLKYMVRIWELYLKQHEGVQKLPVILPLVIYHGQANWNIDTHFSGLFDAPEELANYIPDYEYRLYDISHMSDDEIKGTVLLRIILMTFKYIRHPDLHHRLDDIFNLFNEIKNKTKGLEYLEALLRYFSSCVDSVTYDEVQKTIARTIKDGGDIMQTMAQQWLKEGREEGIEKNKWDVVKNALKMGLSVDAITQLTGYTEDKIKQLAKQLKTDKAVMN